MARRASARPDIGMLFKARRQYPHRVLVLGWAKYSRGDHKVEPKAGAWFGAGRHLVLQAVDRDFEF
jgi:hypothetical protein